MELIIDADAHVTESPDVWTARVSSKWGDLVPRVVRDDASGEDFWHIGGKKTTICLGATAPAGAGLLEWPKNFDECAPITWNASDRLGYMDSAGIWAQVIYPNAGGFGNAAFLELPDDELRLACVRAYNDWLAEWCSTDSRRLLGVAALPFWDVQASVKEIERCAELGHRGILFTGEPQRFTGKFFADRHWDPLWEAASETGLPISFHLGSGASPASFDPVRSATYGKRATTAFSDVYLCLHNAMQVADFLLSGVLPRYPNLKIVSVESGADWVPAVLSGIDHSFEWFEAKRDFPQYEAPPSEYFRRQVYVCYLYDNLLTQTVAEIGADNLLFETDFPHLKCITPGEAISATIETSHAGLSREDRRKMTFGNAAKLYNIPAPSTVS